MGALDGSPDGDSEGTTEGETLGAALGDELKLGDELGAALGAELKLGYELGEALGELRPVVTERKRLTPLVDGEQEGPGDRLVIEVWPPLPFGEPSKVDRE